MPMLMLALELYAFWLLAGCLGPVAALLLWLLRR